MGTLKRGSRGDDVEQLQRDLGTAGFGCGPPDGVFGARTQRAVEQLQRASGLDDDGVVGPRTREALADLLARGEGVAADAEGEPEAEDDLGELGAVGAGVAGLAAGAAELLSAATGALGSALGALTGARDPVDNAGGELARRWRRDVYRHGPSGRSLAWKGRPADVDLADRTHVCCHITAVTFGTSAGRRAAWRQRIEAGEVSDATLRAYGHDPSDPATTEGAATRMALHERFWSVAYHWVGLLNGDVLLNNGPERYTYHGNRSNAFALGVAAEAVLPGRESRRGPGDTEVTETFVETNRRTLRLAVTTAREAGAPMTHVTAHRCYSMTREGDPGEAYWRHVVLPVAAELDLTVDHGAVDGGRPIPREWDPASPFDWSGARAGG